MKASKGKEYILPDEAYNIQEYHYLYKKGHYNLKKYFLNVFNRKIRRYFKKAIREGKDETN